jgi:hypothetical protein
MKVWLGKVWRKNVFVWSHTAVVLCIEVHKRREKLRGRERKDASRYYSRNYTLSKLSCFLYVAAMKGNCVCSDQGCIHSADSVEKHFLN